MSRKDKRHKIILFDCPKCGEPNRTNNRRPRCCGCKTSLKIVKINPHVVVEIRRTKKTKNRNGVRFPQGKKKR